jgi:hypothetical protein
MDLSGKWIDQAHHHRKLTKVVLDMDSISVAAKSPRRRLRTPAERGRKFIRAGKSLPATLRGGSMSVKTENRGPRRLLSRNMTVPHPLADRDSGLRDYLGKTGVRIEKQ